MIHTYAWRQFWTDLESLLKEWQAAGYPQAAERFHDAVGAAIETLRENPGRGHAQPALQPAGLRTLPVPGFPNYALYYRQPRPQAIEFLRLRYRRANPDTLILPADTRILPGPGGGD